MSPDALRSLSPRAVLCAYAGARASQVAELLLDGNGTDKLQPGATLVLRSHGISAQARALRSPMKANEQSPFKSKKIEHIE